jgi:hypothetical protein
MKMKQIAFLLPLFAAAYLFAFAAPPIYPGAKLVDDLNKGLKKAGQDMIAYNTFDAYEKVYDFYQSKGGELRRGRPSRDTEKQATFQFKESGYFVTVLWKEDAKEHGTVIYIGKVARPGA